MNKKVICPVCGKHIFTEELELCPVCNWCHWFLQEENPNRKNMDNIMSLNEAKEAYKNGEEIY